MRLAISLAVLLVASAAFAVPTIEGPATAGNGSYQYEPTRDIKWMQLPLVGGSAIASQYDFCDPLFEVKCADDFFCEDGDEIVAVEWWGQYWNGSPFPPAYFTIRFYSDNPGPPSTPAELLYLFECYDYNEEYDPNYDQYHYFCEIPPFFQEAGNIYWLSVQPALCFPPQWGWCQCAEEYYWNDQGVLKSDYFGVPNWTEINILVGYYVEFSFILHSPFSPVEDSTWGGIKALYR